MLLLISIIGQKYWSVGHHAGELQRKELGLLLRAGRDQILRCLCMLATAQSSWRSFSSAELPSMWSISVPDLPQTWHLPLSRVFTSTRSEVLRVLPNARYPPARRKAFFTIIAC